jgi:dCMP deaminase
MKKSERYINLYMDIAERISKMSHARRLQVGSVLVKNDSIISYGWNGMPAGWDNNCEDEIEERQPISGVPGACTIKTILKTKPEVLHAEANCLMKVAKTTNSSLDSTLYITHAPCINCAKLIYQSGVKSVFYKNVYRNEDGIDFLKSCKIEVVNTH